MIQHSIPSGVELSEFTASAVPHITQEISLLAETDNRNAGTPQSNCFLAVVYVFGLF